DVAGNLLVPVNWQGILANDRGVPVPRKLRATIQPPAAIKPPNSRYLASYTPEGGLLPPIFVPESDPDAPGTALTLFGTADAPYTVLRLARRVDTCAAGLKQGIACLTNADCPGSTCPTTCAGGPNDGMVCTSDAQCTPARCGKLFDLGVFTSQSGTGPLVLTRLGPGFCQADTSTTCTTDGDCGTHAPCVGYAMQAETPVPLDGLVQSSNVFAFVVNEGVAGKSLNGDMSNGDNDEFDSVVTLQDKITGVVQPIGADPVCGVTGNFQGRAVERITPVADSPAVAVEGDVVAFLESEADENLCDANGDGDVFDSVLRIFRLGPTEVRPSANLAVDAAPLVNDRSVAISSGRVFVRTPETAAEHNLTQLISKDSGGVQSTDSSSVSIDGGALSADGRYVVFMSNSILDPADPDAARDVYLRDRATNTTTLVGVDGSGTNLHGLFPAMTGDARFIAFASGGGSPVPDQIYARDRNGPGATDLVSVDAMANPGNGVNENPSISADGRYVVFESTSTNLDPAANNAFQQIILHDRTTGANQLVSGTPGPTVVPGNNSSFAPVISADGSAIAFHTFATNLVPAFPGAGNHVIYCTRSPLSCTIADLNPAGQPGFGIGQLARLSADGRFVGFASQASDLLPCTFCMPGIDNVFIRDMRSPSISVERISTSIDATDGDNNSDLGEMSADMRYVAFYSLATNLVPVPASGSYEVYLRDRVTATTERLTFNTGGPDGRSFAPSISADGRVIAFSSYSALLPEDTNSCSGQTPSCSDAYVHALGKGSLCGNGIVNAGEECDPPGAASSACTALYGAAHGTCGPTCQCNDLTQDGTLGQTILQVVDGTSGAVTTLCPADQVVVAGGAAAFLRPESAGASPGCTLGPDLNGSPTDDIVHYWPGSGAVQNLQRAAVAVSMGGVCSASGTGCGGDVDCPTGQSCSPPWI